MNSKGGTHFNGERKDCLGIGETGSLQEEKNVRSLTSGTIRLNHRWIKDLNVKDKHKHHEVIGDNLCNLGPQKDFLYKTLRIQATV